MIRVYFDWSIISNLKNSEYQEINEFIEKYKEILLFPYSPAHFKDLMKSYSPKNELFKVDLDKLEYLSGKHLIRWGEKGIEPLFATPSEYFQSEKENKEINDFPDLEKAFGDLENITKELGIDNPGLNFKELFSKLPSEIEINEENKEILKKMFPNLNAESSQWDLLMEMNQFSKNLLNDGKYYKDFRKSLTYEGFKLDDNSGNWTYDEVIKNIDEFLLSLGTKMTFLEYVETIFKHKKEAVNRYEFYTTAYLLLDMIGYKRDKLPKESDNIQNIQTDADHSFYGAYCDYFIAFDKNLIIKSKVLYNEFKISTTILEPSEFVERIGQSIGLNPAKENLIDDALSLCKIDNLVESIPAKENNGIEVNAYKLNNYYFNFFNYIIYYKNVNDGEKIITFRKVFKNFSGFIYYSESESLINSLIGSLGYEDSEILQKKKQEYIYNNSNTYFEWRVKGGIVKLDKEVENMRPILHIYFNLKSG